MDITATEIPTVNIQGKMNDAGVGRGASFEHIGHRSVEIQFGIPESQRWTLANSG